jgi:prevent-host-death family protein
MAHARVGIRALKNDLSQWVARVRAGAEIVVTDRGTPVARLVPAGGDTRLEALIAAGLVERAPRPSRSFHPRPRVRLRGSGPSMADYVNRQRR